MATTTNTITAIYPSIEGPDNTNKNQDNINGQENFSIARVFTLLWIIISLFAIPYALYFVNGSTFNFANIELNTIGDYLAGVAAPIAFLWLVLGYRQQGKELSNGNEMLRLQHIELQNSVKAQNNQADSMKKQLDILVREKFHPKFKLQSINYYAANDYIEIIIENTSNEVGFINIILNSDEMALENFDTIEQITTIQIQTLSDMGTSFTIKLQINSTLETGMVIADCFKIDYNVLRHNHLLDSYPPLERIQCIGQI